MKITTGLLALLLTSPVLADDCPGMTPPYYTYLGVCYEGNPNMNISAPQNPQPVTVYSTYSPPAPSDVSAGAVSVSEPGILPLMFLALVGLIVLNRRRYVA